MAYLLNVIYFFLLVAASPWLLYAAIMKGKYQQGFAEKLLGRVPRRNGERPCVWFHAVSVGEANLLQTLIPRLEAKWPDVECVISVTTKSAFDMARKKYAPRCVFYCPLDFSWAVKQALSRVRPDMLVLAELELWPNLIGHAERSGVKLAVVNGRLSDSSYRGYWRVRPLISSTLRKLDFIGAQNEVYAERFASLGAKETAVAVTGSLKFDGANTNRDNAVTRQLAELAGITGNDVVFLAGSTQAPEEELAVAAYRQLAPRFPQLRLVIVPRHPERFAEVAGLLENSGLPWARRTSLEQSPSSTAGQASSDAQGGMGQESNEISSPILLVDTIGELGAWWGTCHIAFVGGSMGSRGGQNMIEPAAYGAAVSFGPKTRNFRDVVSLMCNHDAAQVVDDGDELHQFVERCLKDEPFRAALGRNAQQLVESHRGAADVTVERLGALLAADKSERSARAA